jgi:TetR/AcrR family transcriptional repressor of mexCD-oprJ operon
MAEATTDHRRAVAERNVEAILDAAGRLLERREQPSISAVAAEAGVSRPTVYAHFPDRRRLLAAVVERAVRRLFAEADALELDRGPADEALARLIDASWKGLSRHAHMADAALSELDPEALRHSHHAAHNVIHDLVKRGRREGAFRTDVPAGWLVTSYFALAHAAHDDVSAGRLSGREAHRALARTVTDLFRGG